MTAKLKEFISWRFALMLVLLLLGGVFINLWERAGEAHVARRPLKDLPARLGEWQQSGANQRFDPEVENVLRADDYVVRSYALADNRRAVSVYVGYYMTQKTGITYHSPLNCMPGSGWTMSEPARISIRSADGSRSFEANRYIVQNGEDKQLLIYWYQGRGRAVASEYWDKLYTVMDSARKRRSDGAMVRLMTPVAGSEETALKLATDMAGQLALALPEYVPD